MRGSGLRASFFWELLCFASVLATIELAHGLGGTWLRWHVSVRDVPPIAEGAQWWSGRLDIPERVWDSAYVEETGKAYNVFPPLLSVIGFLATAPLPWRAEPGTFPEFLPLILFGLPLPFVGYMVFRRRTGSAFWGAVLTLAWLGGTAVLPCLRDGRSGGVWPLMHLLSQVGLLLLANELLGRRRTWVALIGLLITAWSRQLTGVFALALLGVAWRGRAPHPLRSKGWGITPARSRNPPPFLSERMGHPCGRGAARPRRMAGVLAGLALIVAVPMGLNWAKFGNPFRTGYALLYVNRDHDQARDARAHGLFSTHFVPRNAYYMNAAIPWTRTEDGSWRWRPSVNGVSIWLTTPLLALILVGVRTGWRDAAVRALRVRPKTLVAPPSRRCRHRRDACATGLVGRTLMVCTLPIVAAHLCYHATGATQPGYYRFALDFIPVWFVVGAPWLVRRWRRWVTLGCTAWSVGYFALLYR